MLRFVKFCLVGVLGFIVDVLSFYFFIVFIDELLVARLFSFWLAAHVTWLGNLIFTFRKQAAAALHDLWYKYMLAVHLSGSINLLVFYILQYKTAVLIAFCLGIVSGLLANYLLSMRFVFHSYKQR